MSFNIIQLQLIFHMFALILIVHNARETKISVYNAFPRMYWQVITLAKYNVKPDNLQLKINAIIVVLAAILANYLKIIV